MTPLPTKLLAVLCAAVLCAPGSVATAEGPASRLRSPEDAGAAAIFFEKEIRPVLAAKCFKCHGAKRQKAGLRLDSRVSMLEGGESGPPIAPGKPEASLLLEALRYEDLEMPPGGQLSEKTIRLFERWIAGGAIWPEETEPVREPAGAITSADRNWWAFRPLEKPRPPVLDEDDWSVSPIDRFVFRRLAENDMRPAPRADRITLARRLYLDLVGVPPSPEEIRAFVEDRSPDAWEALVERLLRDERYGEHWARFWLDLVRYSESDGWNQDAYRPHIWRYRDWVVRAFNEDKPYPEFVREQLAGDEIPDDDPDHLTATGFLRLGIYEYNQRDARGHWNDIMNEMTDVAGDVFLGMSMGCARCHDHKFDPIPQKDYFKLRAFFEPVCWRDDLPAATRAEQRKHEQQLAVWEDATLDIRARIDALLKPYHDRKWKSTVDKFPLDIQACFHKPARERTSWEHQMAYLVSRQFLEEGGGPLKNMKKEDREKHEALKKELAAFDGIKPPPLPAVMTATDFSGPITATVIPDDPEKEPIAPGFLAALSKVSAPGSYDVRPGSSGRRTALARWIAQPDNPLTTRVIVNRIWQQHFGQGIALTPSNFGRTGERPTHPELLDWLTATFVESGWRFKELHRLILRSAVWRQSAHHPGASEYESKDPRESLIWRARVRRLTAEQIRDAMLSVSGELEARLGGPSVDEDSPRRALYVRRFRNRTETFLHAFDAAAGLKSVATRNTTTTPTQSLLLFNGEYALGRARKLAERLLTGEHARAADLVCDAVLRAWGREPTEAELASSLQFVTVSSGVTSGVTSGAPAAQKPASIDEQRLADFCHILFNSNEFLYVD